MTRKEYKVSKPALLFDGSDFSKWNPLNDTIMGGSSSSLCKNTDSGLLVNGTIIERGGGFISVRSPILNPPYDLSGYRGIRIEIDGNGNSMKFSLGCRNDSFIFSRFINGNIRWINTFPTNEKGTTIVDLIFNSFKPVIRSKKVKFPVFMDTSKITRFQLLYSKFGEPSKLNPDFKPGQFSILLRSISGII